MQRPFALRLLAFFFILFLLESTSFGQIQSQPPASPAQPTHSKRGFFDYVLDKINANGNDYGSSMQTGRDAIVEQTVEDLYFWSNVVTLLLLTTAVAAVLLQWRSADKKEVIAAALIAELWNGRVSDRIEIARRTDQFNRLVETHNGDVERKLMLKAQTSETAKEGSGSLNKNVQKVTAKSVNKGFNGDPTQLRLNIDRPDETVGGLPMDPQQASILLQRRVEALQNSEQNLKQRLNQTTLLLDQERRRNASLKGA